MSDNEAYALFIDYLKRQLSSINGKINNIVYYNSIKQIYNEIRMGDFLAILKYYDTLSRINSSIKDSLDIISYLVNNNITQTPQMEESIQKILSDKTLLRLANNIDSHEELEERKERIINILNDSYTFDDFKEILLRSGLDDEVIINLLTQEAKKTIKLKSKELPSLNDESTQTNGILLSNNEMIKKVNELIERYYHLIESKPSNLIDMYKKTLLGSSMTDINNLYSDKEVRLCMNILNLLKIKSETTELLESNPIDYALIEINTEDLTIAYNTALVIAKDYEIQRLESIPRESNVYYLLDKDEVMFDIEDFSEDEKKNIESILNNLESGLYDYEINKGYHTIIKQRERRDLNIFVNKKRNILISYIRINSDELDKSKVLVLTIADASNLYTKSISIVKRYGELIDDTISKIKANDPEFISKQMEFKTSFENNFTRGEVL